MKLSAHIIKVKLNFGCSSSHPVFFLSICPLFHVLLSKVVGVDFPRNNDQNRLESLKEQANQSQIFQPAPDKYRSQIFSGGRKRSRESRENYFSTAAVFFKCSPSSSSSLPSAECRWLLRGRLF